MKISMRLNDLKNKIYKDTQESKYLDEINDIISAVEKMELLFEAEPMLDESLESVQCEPSGIIINIDTVNIFQKSIDEAEK